MADPAWERRFVAGRNHSRWPWSDVVSLMSRYAGPAPLRVLELGCGVGANIPFFEARGDAYYAVEGSRSAVAEVHRKFPAFAANVFAGDFTETLPGGGYDLILDRAALTHNATAEIRRALANAQAALRPGGLFLGIDWFSTAHGDAKRGRAVDDFTREDASEGQFVQLGRVHFSDEAHLRELFAAWELLVLEHKVVEARVPAPARFAAWNLVALRTGAR